MGIEIERKFLVKGTDWRSMATGTLYRQGYIPTVGKQTVRVRIAGQSGYLTLKGPTVNFSRSEFEYSIPLQDAQQMLEQLCDQPLIEKVRYRIPWHDLVWEVDEFLGDNAGLFLAEVELCDPQQPITLPDWIGEEVSHDPCYRNAYLARNPYRHWT
jgi:adenylate cyclase